MTPSWHSRRRSKPSETRLKRCPCTTKLSATPRCQSFQEVDGKKGLRYKVQQQCRTLLVKGKTEYVQVILSGYASRIFNKRRVPIPDPVPPPREWKSWNPWAQSAFSTSFRMMSITSSTISAPSV